MKLIAYYLPQFHEIPENNEWWGNGFTEWYNVKKAIPLYKNHFQPRIPLNDNYYDLMNKDTMLWETKLLNDYNIYGLCYYHYWFSGRKLLEKPAEKLLEYTDINQRFCFCWANATWRKTWTKGNEILLLQEYGNKKEWEEHLNYLLPFFKDKRYIKVDNKPIFVVLNLNQIENSKERFEYYNEYCKNNGFAGIELIQSFNIRKQETYDYVESITLREPSISHYSNNNIVRKIINRIKRNKKINFFKKPIIYKWEKISEKSLSYDKGAEFTKKTYLGAFKEWDSTSRHGKHGFVITKSTPEQFENYLREIKRITETRKNVQEYVFFTAWNEWCECCYLEPDTIDEYKYLEVIKKICSQD